MARFILSMQMTANMFSQFYRQRCMTEIFHTHYCLTDMKKNTSVSLHTADVKPTKLLPTKTGSLTAIFNAIYVLSGILFNKKNIQVAREVKFLIYNSKAFLSKIDRVADRHDYRFFSVSLSRFREMLNRNAKYVMT